MSNQDQSLPYSYHTFLFPFIWKTDESVKIEDLEQILKAKDRWIEVKWAEIFNNNAAEISLFQNYQAYQYFTDAANNAIFNANDKGVCRCYTYGLNGGKYVIEKGQDTFTLTINQIRLNVYDAGIGILVFEMENHEHGTLDAVNKINEYGRRINFPFLVNNFSHPLCADRISITFDATANPETGAICIEEDFLHTSKNILAFIAGVGQLPDDNKNSKRKLSLNYVMKPIQYVLDGGENKITSNPDHRDSDGKFLITPCIDDRMFVCCMVLDSTLSRELQGIDENEISYLNDCDLRLKRSGADIKDSAGGTNYEDCEEGWSDETTLSSRLYKLIYIEKDLTCQDNGMKFELLKNSIYKRWINRGTIYAVTHHSLICVNNGANAIIGSVINPFLIIYVQIAILTVAQRSILLMLENEAAEVSNSFRDDTEITMAEITKIEKLQERYVKIQNQILLSEITVQEQGVELYEMLRNQLYIERNMADLDNEMKNLKDIVHTASARLERISDETEEHKFNMIGILMGALALLEPLAMIIALKGEERCEGIVWFVISAVACILIYCFVHFKHKSD